MPYIGGARQKLNKNIKRKVMYVTKSYYQSPDGKKYYYEPRDNASRQSALRKATKKMNPKKDDVDFEKYIKRKHSILFGKK